LVEEAFFIEDLESCLLSIQPIDERLPKDACDLAGELRFDLRLDFLFGVDLEATTLLSLKGVWFLIGGFFEHYNSDLNSLFSHLSY